MCTCLRINHKIHYFGRTLDLDIHYHEEAVITPRNYKFIRPNGHQFINRFALIGTAMVVGDYPMYYEAANEHGLSIAGLNFPNNATYFKPQKDKINVPVFELIPFLLGNYKSIKEIRPILENLVITDEVFSPRMPLPTLHFMVSDKDECIVFEQVQDGIKIYDNPYNVMTNNPPFDLQIENLKKYQDLTNIFKVVKDERYSCVGLDAIGLPGDYSSQSRFVKTHFMQKYAKEYASEQENIGQFFHILDSVSMVKNTVLTKDKNSDITFYACCINASKGIYYYKTYYNNQINALKMNNENMNSQRLTRHELITKEHINYIN